jgi:hypothetical protein
LDQPTIQAAINVANNGATVLVAPGTYSENIDFKGKAITVTSERGPEVTIIDGGNVAPVVSFISGERRDSAINGFTLQNGRASFDDHGTGLGGGGVRVENSSPTITNNVIKNNHACYAGGIGINSGSPLVQRNAITNNDGNLCSSGGAGISIMGDSSVEILDNVISNNGMGSYGSFKLGGGIYREGTGTLIVKRNIIKGNDVADGQGGGVWMMNGSNALFVQNIITGNRATAGGGLYWSAPGPILVNNTIVDNDGASMGSGIYANGFNAQTELTNNIIVARPGQAGLYCTTFSGQNPSIIRFNNIFSAGGMAYGGRCPDMTGTNGNISADPMFTAPTQGDYHLQFGSPSIDKGDNQASNLLDKDIDGDSRILDGDDDGTATIDMGVDEFLFPPGLTTPISAITFPGKGEIIFTGTNISITGVARDGGGGTIARVEVSVDGGANWNLATGTTAWRYDWTPAAPGPATIRSRAVADSGNVQDPPTEIAVTVRLPFIIRVPLDLPTIQSAIDAATSGYTVQVAPGTYSENINFKGKAITVRSESGPQNTIIDGGNADPVIIFNSGEGRASTLNGFTLQNGRAYANHGGYDGGGVKVENSSPTITNNLITNNHACSGGGIGIHGGSPLIQMNVITNNDSSLCSSGGGGGGIYISGYSSAETLEILDNVISDNVGLYGADGGGIKMNGAGTPIVKGNIIKGNRVPQGAGGGIWMLNDSSPLFVQNLITGNQSGRGAGLYWYASSHAPILINNTIADNDSISTLNASSVFVDGDGVQMELTNNIIVAKPGQTGLYCGGLHTQNPPIVRSNNIFSSGGTAYGGSCSDMIGTNGNISADPLLNNPTDGDYHLQQGSLSIDSGYNLAANLPFMDLDKHPRILDGDGDGIAIVDMGAYESTYQDVSSPTSTITFPTEGATIFTGITVTITGTASDAGGGTVARVEVSVDGGATWNLATGTNTWSYDWRPALTSHATIKSRAVDNSGNVQNPPAEITVTVQDATPPTSTITSPTAGAIVLTGTAVSISGTSSDAGGGTVARVDVSVDGGSTWSAATGTTAWSFSWTPITPGPATISSRAVDNSGNQQDPPAGITVTVRTLIRVPSDQPTIQAAINVANNGDTVLVAPGTYHENIYFGGKAITVTSENGPDVTIIDGRAADPVVIFNSGEGRDSTLDGFTLQNGRAANNQGFGQGGGVRIEGSSPTITNNVITNNYACDAGGVFINASSPLIQKNKITSNTAGADICQGGTTGGGIYVLGPGSAEILDNVISDNVSSFGGGIGLTGAGTPIVKRNIIKGNSRDGAGGGIWIAGNTAALIVQNLITGNHASIGGGVYWIISNGVRGPILINNTIADNDGATNGSAIYADGADGQVELTNNIIIAKPGQTGLYCGDSFGQDQPIIRFNNIFGSGGMSYGGSCSDMTGTNGNISADPLFTNPTQGDYHIQQGSPSIDSGDNQASNLPDTDIDGDPRILDGDGIGNAIIDMGVDEFLALPNSGGKSQGESVGLNLHLFAAPPAPSKPLLSNLRPNRRNRLNREFHPAVLDSWPSRLKPVLYLDF